MGEPTIPDAAVELCPRCKDPIEAHWPDDERSQPGCHRPECYCSWTPQEALTALNDSAGVDRASRFDPRPNVVPIYDAVDAAMVDELGQWTWEVPDSMRLALSRAIVRGLQVAGMLNFNRPWEDEVPPAVDAFLDDPSTVLRRERPQRDGKEPTANFDPGPHPSMECGDMGSHDGCDGRSAGRGDLPCSCSCHDGSEEAADGQA